jgi:hypothetical protein
MIARAALAASLLIFSAPGSAGPPAVAVGKVPFVGCHREGQAGTTGGPISAPPSAKVPAVSGPATGVLAYYWSGDLGVLAPRGWHCFGFYGSGGYSLLVTPYTRQTGDFYNRRLRFLGPAVEVTFNYGRTSGRTAVLDAIGRYFPAHRGFIRETDKIDLLLGPLPRGPYPTDSIQRRSADSVRYGTPAGKSGQGTTGLLAPGPEPVEGIRKLVNLRDGPDLLAVNVRLPAAAAALTDVILSSAEYAR